MSNTNNILFLMYQFFQMIEKETKNSIVVSAVNCLTNLANGLGKYFLFYGLLCFDAVIEKFKDEKNAAVYRKCIDAIYDTVNILHQN